MIPQCKASTKGKSTFSQEYDVLKYKHVGVRQSSVHTEQWNSLPAKIVPVVQTVD